MYSTTIRLKEGLGTLEELLLQDVTDIELVSILTETSAIIDTYIAPVVSLPLSEPNTIIDTICIDISKAECYRRFASNDIPDDLKDKDKQAFRTLEKIQNRKLIIQSEETNSDVIFEAKPQHFTQWI